MAMVTQIDEATGATPTWGTAITAVKFGGDDVAVSTVAIATPTSTGTNFSFVKSLAIDIVTVNSLNMTALKVFKGGSEPTGMKLWFSGTPFHAIAAYTQATVAPTASGSNGGTPTINGIVGTALPLQASASQINAGPFNSTGRQGNLFEVVLGIDNLNTFAGTSGAGLPAIGFTWIEG